MNIGIALIVAIIGGLIYLLADKLPAGLGELGRIAFFAGLLAVLLGK